MNKPELGQYIVKTLNQRGYAIHQLDPYTSEFIQEASQSKASCLEIGAAFGFATIDALKQGATIIANDVSEAHLHAIWENTPIKFRPHLTLLPGSFPYGVILPKQAVQYILISRVTHYFSPAEMDSAIIALFELLKPGGKVFLISETPYGKMFEKFIPVYERQKSLMKWPGYIDNLPLYMEHFSDDNPSQMLLLGKEELKKAFLQAGFSIEKCAYFSRKGVFPKALCLGGKESIGIIAQKPNCF